LTIEQAANISAGLKSCRPPQNAGKIRGPIAKIMPARNPTVSAWREAPLFK
jgi:hypothetical protein